MPANANDANAFARSIAAGIASPLDALTEAHGSQWAASSTGESGEYSHDNSFAFSGPWADPHQGGVLPVDRASRILKNAYVRPVYAEYPKISDEHYGTCGRPSDWKANPDLWPRYPEDTFNTKINPSTGQPIGYDGTVTIGKLTNICGHDRQHLATQWMRALAKQKGLLVPVLWGGQTILLDASVTAKAILGVYSRRVVGQLRNYFLGKPNYTDTWRAEAKTIDTILNAIDVNSSDAQDQSDFRTFYEQNLYPAYTSGWGTPLARKTPDGVYHSPGLVDGDYFQPNELAILVPALYRLALWMDAVGYDEKWRKIQWALTLRHASLLNSAVGPDGSMPDFILAPAAVPINPPATFDGMVKSYPIWTPGAPPSVYTYSRWAYKGMRIAEELGLAGAGGKADAILQMWQAETPIWSVLGFDNRNWMVRVDGTHEVKNGK